MSPEHVSQPDSAGNCDTDEGRETRLGYLNNRQGLIDSKFVDVSRRLTDGPSTFTWRSNTQSAGEQQQPVMFESDTVHHRRNERNTLDGTDFRLMKPVDSPRGARATIGTPSTSVRSADSLPTRSPYVLFKKKGSPGE